MGCYDEKSATGGIWLDEKGRSCLFYEHIIVLRNETCNDTLLNETNPNWACCICRGVKSLSRNMDTIVDYDSIWSIVVVSFCLLLVCILSCTLYFVCHLYRNEKNNNTSLLKSKHLMTQNGMSKLDISKNGEHNLHNSHNLHNLHNSHNELEDDNEYAAIPGDIGIGKKDKKDKKDKKEIDIIEDDYQQSPTSPTSPASSHTTIFKIRPSFRLSKQVQVQNIEQIADDEYAAIDNTTINKYTKNEQDVNNIKNEIFKKKQNNPKIIALKKSNDNGSNNKNKNNKNNNTKPYKNKRQRRYSAELELNQSSTEIRKRHSSRFQHSAHQTQDDMIFLSFEQYIQEPNDGNTMYYDDQKEQQKQKYNNNNNNNNNDQKEITDNDIVPELRLKLKTKEEFTRLSTRRIVKLYEPPEIKYNEINFTNCEFIGRGSFGEVIRAKYHEIDVAVKKLHRKKLNGQELVNFKREAAIMQKVGGHKHIARMYGFCTKPEICIVTEYYERGSLYDIIKKNKKGYLSTQLKIQMSIEASLGIWHLHKQQVIHRDISARNLLVDNNWTVVIADLGMSRLKSNIIIKSNIGPVKWMAPESIIGHEYSEKSDSYAFGITLYEIFSESEPYPGLLPLEAGAKVVHEGLRPSIDKNKTIQNVPNLSKLLTMLWKPQPKDRPDFLFITQSLKKIKKQWLIKKRRYKH